MAGAVELPEGFVLDSPSDELPEGFVIDSQPTSSPKIAASSPPGGFMDWVRRGLQFNDRAMTAANDAAVRPIAKGIATSPLMAMDAGVGVRNVLTGGDYELPSAMFGRSLDEYTQAPTTPLGKSAEFVSSALVGSRMPMPQLTSKITPTVNVPAEVKDIADVSTAFRPSYTNIKTPNTGLPLRPTVRDLTLQAGREQGLIVPPSTTNPSLTNRALESVGGKIATAQDASLKNQPIFNSMARRALGLADDAELTPEMLRTVRAQASSANQAIRQTGTIQTDAKFADDLAGILNKYKSASGVSKKLASSEVADLAESFERKFPASDAVDAIQVLRDRAKEAYAAGSPENGKAYRALSKTLEDQIERHLEGLGKGGKDLLKSFREGRQLLAKSYSVENAVNPGTGNIIPSKIAQQLSRGKPLSGELKTIGKFAQAFPRASQQIVDSGAVRNTDVILGAGTAALSREPAYLLYPFARQMARSGLLSDTGQAFAAPRGFRVPPGLLGSSLSIEEQLRQGLFQ